MREFEEILLDFENDPYIKCWEKKMNDINLEHPECEYDFSEACEKLYTDADE